MMHLPGERQEVSLLDEAIIAAAARTVSRLREVALTVVTAESCTGGLVAAALTHHAGSSDVVLGGMVTYSNGMKHRLLDVPLALLDEHGAVSEAVARAMVAGALLRSDATCAVAITGIAGPGGGTAEKPVGLVWLAACRSFRPALVRREVFAGDRSAVRSQAVIVALRLIEEAAAPSR